MKNSKQSQTQRQTKLTHFLNNRVSNKPTSHNLKLPHQKKEERRPSRSPQSSRSPHSHTESLSSSLSALNSSSLLPRNKPLPPQQPKIDNKVQLNVQFYLNRMPSQPNGEFIDKIHAKWHSDYQRLQRDHSFIQWLFPNSFQSRFNSHARPLSVAEAELFKASPQILQRYVHSYTMMLGFYGMKLKSKLSGQLVRSRHPDYKERFYKTLQTSFHNHMRITRMLCSLSELGFHSYATQLARFLRQEIYTPDGALKSLAKYNVYQQWKPYEKMVEDEGNSNVYMARLKKSTKHLHLQPVLKAEEKKQVTEGARVESAEGEPHLKQT